MDSRFLQSYKLQNIDRADDKAIKGSKGYYFAACELNPDQRFVEEQIL